MLKKRGQHCFSHDLHTTHSVYYTSGFRSNSLKENCREELWASTEVAIKNNYTSWMDGAAVNHCVSDNAVCEDTIKVVSHQLHKTLPCNYKPRCGHIKMLYLWQRMESCFNMRLEVTYKSKGSFE